MKISTRQTNLNDLRFTIKHRLFVFERKWLCHPFFHRFYPTSGFARRLSAAMAAILVLGSLILILFHPGTTEAAWYSDSWKLRKLITINGSKVPSTQTNFPVLI